MRNFHNLWNKSTTVLDTASWQLPKQPLLAALNGLDGQYQPPPAVILRAFQECPRETLKVVLLGQDAYPAMGKACGLAFAVEDYYLATTTKLPPDSLGRICKVAGCTPKDMFTWPSQGVLMLNTALTVEVGKPGSHLKLWEPFTKAVVEDLLQAEGLVWLLFGKQAQDLVLGKGKKVLSCTIQEDTQSFICTPHPSPLARGFEEADAFNECNRELERLGKPTIKWGNKCES